MENFLSKPAQKELRAKFETALRDVWKTRKGEVDEHMVKFCLGDVAVVVPLSNGRLVVIDKPRIEKDFCFGWSSCGQGATYEECNKTHDAVRADLANYFKEQNIEGFDRRYKDYVEADRCGEFDQLNTNAHYNSQSEDNPLCHLNFNNREWPELDKGSKPITAEDLHNFVEAVKFVRADFAKRIDTYLKKYGTKKLRTWTYWVDD